MNTDHIHTSVNALIEPVVSPAMKTVARTLERVVSCDLNILIVGENGTGKEWLARRIHMLSPRSDKPFWPVYCSALLPDTIEREIFGFEMLTPAGLDVRRGAFEESLGGTMFFDALSHLPAALQIQLAGALEHQRIRRVGGYQDVRVDVRVVAALDRKPDALLADGALRKEIYYRINPIVIELPRLRERREDIPPLVDRFIQQANSRHGTEVTGIDDEALARCAAYHWPGNIRELKNAVEYAVLMTRSARIAPDSLPLYMHEQESSQPVAGHQSMNVASVEKSLIEQALKESRTKKQAAKLLGISLKTLYNKLSRYNLYEKFVQENRVRQAARVKKTAEVSGVATEEEGTRSRTPGVKQGEEDRR